MCDWWKSYKTMKAVQNIAAAWNEVKLSCMNGILRNIQPDVVKRPSRPLLVQDTIRQVVEDIAVMMEDCSQGTRRIRRAPLADEKLMAIKCNPRGTFKNIFWSGDVGKFRQ